MMEVSKDISKSGLQVHSFCPKVKLSKGQKGLLDIIRECVGEQKSISWDVLVKCFYENVSKKGSDYKYIGNYPNNSKEWYEYDIWESYQLQNSQWQYCVKPRVKQWFVSSIGILVIKNQLIVIPTIEIE